MEHKYIWRLMSTLLVLLVTPIAQAASPLFIGIAGGSGSGKTTFSANVQQVVGDDSVIISQDAYYRDLSHLTENERETVNFDHPDAIDSTLLFQHLKALKNQEPIDIPVYNFKTHTRETKTISTEPKDIVIVEGILLLTQPDIRELFDVKIFIDAEDDVRLLRRISRDMNKRGRSLESIHEQYLATVKPMYREFVEPSKRYADIIVPRGGKNQVALELLQSSIQQRLASVKLADNKLQG